MTSSRNVSRLVGSRGEAEVRKMDPSKYLYLHLYSGVVAMMTRTTHNYCVWTKGIAVFLTVWNAFSNGGNAAHFDHVMEVLCTKRTFLGSYNPKHWLILITYHHKWFFPPDPTRHVTANPRCSWCHLDAVLWRRRCSSSYFVLIYSRETGLIGVMDHSGLRYIHIVLYPAIH